MSIYFLQRKLETGQCVTGTKNIILFTFKTLKLITSVACPILQNIGLLTITILKY